MSDMGVSSKRANSSFPSLLFGVAQPRPKDTSASINMVFSGRLAPEINLLPTRHRIMSSDPSSCN